MSFADYDALKLEIIDWCHRDDMDQRIDTFIDLAEAEMLSNVVQPLQLRGEETLVAFATSITDRFVALPTGFQSMRKVRIQIVNGESYELDFRSPAQLNILSTVGMPRFFTVTDQVEMERVSDQVYAGEFQYIQDFTALSSSNTTNTVLTNHPNVYLFGALWALYRHVNNEEEATRYYVDFINAIKGANNKSEIGRYGPAPVMRHEGRSP